MKDQYNKQLGARLKAIRENRDLTQMEVAKLSEGKFNKTKLSNYERGETPTPAFVVPVLCRIYNVTPNQLLGWKEESHGREAEIINDIKRINDFTSEIASKYEDDDILIAASGAENFDESEMEKLREDIEMVKNLE